MWERSSGLDVLRFDGEPKSKLYSMCLKDKQLTS